MTKHPISSTSALWARFRFSVVGALLSAPPARGELKAALESLSAKMWTHPVSGREVRFAAKTLERWLYRARRERDDPVGALRKAVRKDCGKVSLKPDLIECLANQYHDYPHWTYQLHYDNLQALVKAKEVLGPLRSYSTVRRYMVAQGMVRKPRLKPKRHPGELLAALRRERREIRSYEAEYVGALWHLDFHHGSLRVVTARGQWQRPLALGILDDHSRYCAHLQWYLSETTEDLVHGFSQGIQKCGLPRAAMSDNGSAMLAEEFTEGLLRLGILHETTLPFSAYQNGKQESFWAHLEGRLLEMLGQVRELTLDFLNEATQAWVEIEYNRRVHREIGCSPAARFAAAPDVLRESPSSDALRAAFRREVKRRQRQSDGTISLDGVRFEIPSRYRHFRDVVVRYAVPRPGPVLVYLAEDALAVVRERVEGMARHRGLELAGVEIHVITAPSLRLDREPHRQRLLETARRLRPRLLLLDPLVRLHGVDENNAGEVAELLAYFRRLQRQLDLSVILVHHTRKNVAGGVAAGQGLRGSSDLHAFGDSNLYLRRVRERLVLLSEHRAAPAAPAMTLELVASNEATTHLEVVAAPPGERQGRLQEQLLACLVPGKELPRAKLRDLLSVQNQRLGEALETLERAGKIRRSAAGWRRVG